MRGQVTDDREVRMQRVLDSSDPGNMWPERVRDSIMLDLVIYDHTLRPWWVVLTWLPTKVALATSKMSRVSGLVGIWLPWNS